MSLWKIATGIGNRKKELNPWKSRRASLWSVEKAWDTTTIYYVVLICGDSKHYTPTMKKMLSWNFTCSIARPTLARNAQSRSWPSERRTPATFDEGSRGWWQGHILFGQTKHVRQLPVAMPHSGMASSFDEKNQWIFREHKWSTTVSDWRVHPWEKRRIVTAEAEYRKGFPTHDPGHEVLWGCFESSTTEVCFPTNYFLQLCFSGPGALAQNQLGAKSTPAQAACFAGGVSSSGQGVT